MLKYMTSRAGQAVVVIWVVASVVFALVHITPGDPARLAAGQDATPAQVLKMRRQLGLQDSLPQQYVRFLGGVLRGDFGKSIRVGGSALSIARERMANTLRLALVAATISIGCGIALGVLAAAKRGSWIDNFGQVIAIAGQSMPTFWVSILLIMFFAVQLRWLPAAGMGTWRSYILPASALGTFGVASVMRLTRSSMLDALSSDNIIFLRAKGLKERSVLLRHALRNAMLPVMTLASLQLVAYISGSVIVETIFAWPGSGKLLIDSVGARDYPIVQATTFLTCALLVLVNLSVDVLYAVVDPRIRRGAAI